MPTSDAALLRNGPDEYICPVCGLVTRRIPRTNPLEESFTYRCANEHRHFRDNDRWHRVSTYIKSKDGR